MGRRSAGSVVGTIGRTGQTFGWLQHNTTVNYPPAVGLRGEEIGAARVTYRARNVCRVKCG
jgi:hypothetical protein